MQQEELHLRLKKYPSVFGSVAGRTHLIEHDSDVGEAVTVKLPSYRVNPFKLKLVEKELNYMPEHGLVTRTYTHWSSAITPQPKPDCKVSFCVGFRRVNALTTRKADTYPLSRVEDPVYRRGEVTCITTVVRRLFAPP